MTDMNINLSGANEPQKKNNNKVPNYLSGDNSSQQSGSIFDNNSKIPTVIGELEKQNKKLDNASNKSAFEMTKAEKQEAKKLNKEGQTRDMVIDFGDFKNALKKLTDALDHSFIFETGSLKQTTVTALKDEGFLLHEVPFRPTAEQFSRYFYEQLKGLNFPVYDISVYETPTNCSTYREASL